MTLKYDCFLYPSVVKKFKLVHIPFWQNYREADFAHIAPSFAKGYGILGGGLGHI